MHHLPCPFPSYSIVKTVDHYTTHTRAGAAKRKTPNATRAPAKAVQSCGNNGQQMVNYFPLFYSNFHLIFSPKLALAPHINIGTLKGLANIATKCPQDLWRARAWSPLWSRMFVRLGTRFRRVLFFSPLSSFALPGVVMLVRGLLSEMVEKLCVRTYAFAARLGAAAVRR